MFDDGLDPHDQAELERQFQAHLSRGILALGVRVQHLADVARLVQEAQQRFRQSHPGIDEDDLDATPVGAETARSAPASDEEEQPLPGALVGVTGEEAAVAQLLQPEDGGKPPLPVEANSLWGALLPAPVKVAGPKRSARLKRGVASSRKKRRKRR